MIIVSHRGNLNGPGKESQLPENSEIAILTAIEHGFYVEVDIRSESHTTNGVNRNYFWLGHDKKEFAVSPGFLKDHKNNLVIHAKDIQTAEVFSKTDFNWFYHENDPMVITSWRWMWMHPTKFSIMGVNLQFQDPDLVGYINPNSFGICTDYPLKYKGEGL